MGVIQLGSFRDNDGTELRFEADYNDGNRRVTRVRAINGTTKSARVTLLEPDGTIVAQRVFIPNSTTVENVAGNQITVTSEGVDMPYNTFIQFPV